MEKNIEIRCAAIGDECCDRVSDLPDEILVSILSLLTMREAVATCILSRRWRNMWTRSHSLEFDVSNKAKTMSRYANLAEEPAWLTVPEFVEWVESILHVMSSSHTREIDKFEVNYELDQDVAHHIDGWILFALERNAKALKIHVGKYFYHFPATTVAVGGVSSSSYKVQHMNLNGFARLPANFAYFKNLRSLKLKSSYVFDADLEDVLSNCLLLEQLSLVEVKGLTNITISPTSTQQLRHLKISTCWGLQRLEIVEATSLVSLKYQGSAISFFSFNHVPKLASMHFTLDAYDGVIGRVVSKLPAASVEYLGLDLRLASGMTCDESAHGCGTLPTFTNLKHLDLAVPIGSIGFLFPFLLNLAPRLCRFKLDAPSCFGHPHLLVNSLSSTPPSIPPCLQHLQEVELSGFTILDTHVALALAFIKASPALKKIIIHPSRLIGKGYATMLLAKLPPSRVKIQICGYH